MTLHITDLIDKLNDALSREYAHWHYYTHAAICVTGLHREEFQEFFLKEAAGEAEHIHEFGRLIMGLGGVPTTNVYPYPQFDEGTLKSWLEGAYAIEQDVVGRYVDLMDEAEEFEQNGGPDKVHGRYVHIFLEDQILDSRKAVDHIKELLKE